MDAGSLQEPVGGDALVAQRVQSFDGADARSWAWTSALVAKYGQARGFRVLAGRVVDGNAWSLIEQSRYWPSFSTIEGGSRSRLQP